MNFKVAINVVMYMIMIRYIKCDEYIRELRKQCKSTNALFPCAKYGLMNYIANHSIIANNVSLSSGGVRLVEIDSDQDDEDGLFPMARQAPGDSDLTKLFKFFQRQIDSFLKKQGIALILPDSAKVINSDGGSTAVEGRKKKDKKILILNLLILFKLFKIKMMLMSVASGVMFLKKALILGAIFAPLLLKSIKKHCRQSHYYVPHHHHVDEYVNDHEHEYEHDHDDEYGGGGGYWIQHSHPFPHHSWE